MSERPLQDVLVDAPPRRGMPAWVWGCGGGCLLVVLLLVGFTVFVIKKVESEMGPEAAWPEIQAVFPFEEPHPANLTAFRMDLGGWLRRFGGWFGASEEELADVPDFRMFGFTDPAGKERFLFLVTEDESMDFAEDGTNRSPVEFELQGRTVRGIAFDVAADSGPGQRMGLRGGGRAMLLELGRRSVGPVRLFYQHDGGELAIERIVEVLEPFDLWSTMLPEAESPPQLEPSPADAPGEGR